MARVSLEDLAMAMSTRVIAVKDSIVSVDRNGLLWLVEYRHRYLNETMRWLSRLGDWDAWTFILSAMLARRGVPRETARFVLPRILATLGICYTLKRVARRDRPSLSVPGFSALISDPDPYSFPSSHAACSWAVCIAAARKLGGAGWLLPSYAALISYSRVHLGAHYPLDVVIGTAIGTTAGFM